MMTEQERIALAQKRLSAFQQQLQDELGVVLMGIGIERVIRNDNGEAVQYLPPQGALQIAPVPDWKGGNDKPPDAPIPPTPPADPVKRAVEEVKRVAEEWRDRDRTDGHVGVPVGATRYEDKDRFANGAVTD